MSILTALMHWRYLKPSLFIASTLGGGLAFAWFSSQAPVPDRQGTATTAPNQNDPHVSASPGGAVRGKVKQLLQWPEGLVRSFAVDQTSRVETSADRTPLVGFDLQGTLQVVQMPSGWLRMTFTGALALTGSSSQTDGNTAQDLSVQAHQPWFVRLNSSQAQLRVASGVSPFVGRIWESLASQLAVAQQDRTTWEASHVGSLGRCEYRYRRSSPTRITRTSTHCENPSAATAYDSLQLEQAYQLDEAGGLKQLNTKELVQTVAQEPLPALQSSSTTHLKWTHDSRSSYDMDALLADFNASKDLHDLERQAAQNLDFARASGHSLPSAMAQLVASAQQRVDTPTPPSKQNQDPGSDEPTLDTPSQQDAHAYIAMVANLRLGASDHLQEILQHVQQNGPIASILIDALRDAGTEAAQNLLQQISSDSGVERVLRLAATRGLSRVNTPSAATVAHLTTLTQSDDPVIGQQALYGLGSNAYRLSANQNTLSQVIVADLIDRADQAPDAESRRQALIALGNAGDRAAVTTAGLYAQDSAPTVRAGAAQALRRMPGQEPDEILASLLLDDDKRVRLSALDALAERAPVAASVAQIKDLVGSEPTFLVRAQAVRLAVKWLPQVDTLRTPLETAAHDDAFEDIRRLATKGLAQ